MTSSVASEPAPTSRADHTARVTAATLTWLWAQGCRVIAPEVGFGRVQDQAGPVVGSADAPHHVTSLHTPWDADWRVDVAGLDARRKRLIVVEVKGTRADSKRERYDRGKWILGVPGAVHVLALGPDVERPPALPGHWRVWRLAPTQVPVLKADTRADRVGRQGYVDDKVLAWSLRACAHCLTTQTLRLLGAGYMGRATVSLALEKGLRRGRT